MISHAVDTFEYDYYNPQDNTIATGNSYDRKDQRTILFFYPADFTFVCPTELADIATFADNIAKLWQTKLYVVSSDTVHAHQQRIRDEAKLHNFPYPMIGDRNHYMSQYFQIYNEKTGNARRATIIVNPHKVVVSCDVVIDDIGRGAKEIVRRLAALQYTFAHPGQLCPSSREPGEKVIVAGSPSFKPEDFFVTM